MQNYHLVWAREHRECKKKKKSLNKNRHLMKSQRDGVIKLRLPNLFSFYYSQAHPLLAFGHLQYANVWNWAISAFP